MEEEWKDIEGYEGFYQVSNLGRVKSLERTCNDRWGNPRIVKERILKPKINFGGYVVYHLRNAKESKESWPSCHQLVAKAFIPNPAELPTVNHKDGDKLNNCVSNLEWMDYSGQMKHALDNDLITIRGNTLYSPELKAEAKEYYDNNDISIKGLGRKYGFSESVARKVVKGEWGHPAACSKQTIKKMRELRMQGMSLTKIGEIVGKNFSTVHNHVKDLPVRRGYS